MEEKATRMHFINSAGAPNLVVAGSMEKEKDCPLLQIVKLKSRRLIPIFSRMFSLETETGHLSVCMQTTELATELQMLKNSSIGHLFKFHRWAGGCSRAWQVSERPAGG